MTRRSGFFFLEGKLKRDIFKILILMPIKHRVEGFVERYFADKQVNI
jgi:hypothetical protein